MENKSNEIIEQKCPYYRPLLQKVLKFGIMVLGTVGLIFFNLWVAVVYLIYYLFWTFWLMPVKHCQYCYYMVKETTTDNGETTAKLLPKEKWVESYLKKHVECGKKWSFNFFTLWFIPIILIVISFFLNFSIFALLSLIGFVVMLALMLVHTRYKVCPTCAIMKECFEAF